MTEEKTGIDISDSVVMGDVQQNILNIGECPSCSASGGVTIMKCQDKQCTSIKFCNSCHRNCRYYEGHGRVLGFDSPVGSGPFCNGCLTAKITQFDLEKQEQERLAKEAQDEQERLAREAQDEQERLAREAHAEQERLAREAHAEQEILRQRERKIEQIWWAIGLIGGYIVAVLLLTFEFHVMDFTGYSLAEKLFVNATVIIPVIIGCIFASLWFLDQ